MKFLRSSFVLAIAAVVLSTTAFAADATQPTQKPMSHKEMTAEQRQKMAAAHEKMAACLKSESTLESCHMEMKKTCEDNMGEHQCPMMGAMHGMKGKMKHKEMHKEMHEETAEKK